MYKNILQNTLYTIHNIPLQMEVTFQKTKRHHRPAHLPVRYAVTDHVVHRCTHRLGETPVSERGWVRTVLDCLLMYNEIYFICCHANLERTVRNSLVGICYFCATQKHTLSNASKKMTFRLRPASSSTCLAS